MVTDRSSRFWDLPLFRPYLKPFQDPETNLTGLEARGMVIGDRAFAKRCLARIGYYRLSAYWYPFRVFEPSSQDTEQRVRGDMFRPGTTFELVHDFYLFDKSIRLHLIDGLERVEIAVRAALIETLGALDPHAHRNAKSYRSDFAQPDETGASDFSTFLDGLDQSFERSKAEFSKHFRATYEGHPPIWIAAEAWDWGNLAYILSHLTDANTNAVCALIHPTLRRKSLISWMTSLNEARNACAHHSRLWNRPLINSPSLKQRDLPLFDDMRGANGAIPDAQTKRLYGALAVLIFLMRRFHPRTEWHLRLRDLVAGADLPPEIGTKSAGFPEGWAVHDLWRAGQV
ncbi:MAG: Abi family protein [Pseudomonadota bacterium]